MIRFKLKDPIQARIKIAGTGKSIKEFAETIGVSDSYLSMILTGKKKPSVTTAFKITDGLGLDVEDIFLVDANLKEKAESGREASC